MPIVLCRVDDRLVHGQVVIGWGRPLDLHRIVLVDDEVRASPWEQELYRMAAPPEIKVEFPVPREAAPRSRVGTPAANGCSCWSGRSESRPSSSAQAPGALHSSTWAESTPGPDGVSDCATSTCRTRSLRCSRDWLGGACRSAPRICPTSRQVPLADLE